LTICHGAGSTPGLAACLVVGVVAGRWLDLPWWILVAPAAAALAAGVLLTVKRSRASWWLLLLAALLLGGFLGRRAGSREPPGHLPQDVVLEGRALGDEVVRDGRGHVSLRIAGSRGAPAGQFLGAFARSGNGRRITVLVGRGGCNVREGDAVWIRGARLIPERGHRNPDVPRPASRGSVMVAVPGPGAVLASSAGRPWLARLRSRLALRQRETLSPAAAGLAEAVTTGRSEAVHPIVRDAFRGSGAAHLLAVSGLHLALVALAVSGIVRRGVSLVPTLAERVPAQYAAAVATLVTVWTFAAFASARPPVLRAAIMVTAAIVAQSSGRQSTPVSPLFAAGAVLLLFSPWLITSPSFILSFSAVVGIFVGAPRIRSFLAPGRVEDFIGAEGGGALVRLMRIALRWLIEAAAISCAASLATLPAVAWFFGSVPVLSPIVNLAAVPLFSFLFLPAAMGHAAVCILLPRAAGLFAFLVECAAHPVLHVASIASQVPPAAVKGPHGYAASFMAAACLWLLVARQGRAAVAAACASIMLALLPGPLTALVRDHRLDGKLAVVFLDVGQGDGAYVRTPRGAHLLIDAGPAHPGAGPAAPIPSFLEAWRVPRIDTVFISHPHADHHGGLEDLLAAGTRIGEVVLGVDPGDPDADSGFDELVQRLRDAGVNVRGPPRCGPIAIPGLRAEVVHPCTEAARDRSVDLNDRSMVLALRHGMHGILFTGDIGMDVEDDVASALPFACQVLKVPHHGSRHSCGRELLAMRGLRWSVVSSRLGNRHGLPHPLALERFLEARLPILRVDTQGAWTVVTDGWRLTVWNSSSISPI